MREQRQARTRGFQPHRNESCVIVKLYAWKHFFFFCLHCYFELLPFSFCTCFIIYITFICKFYYGIVCGLAVWVRGEEGYRWENVIDFRATKIHRSFESKMVKPQKVMLARLLLCCVFKIGGLSQYWHLTLCYTLKSPFTKWKSTRWSLIVSIILNTYTARSSCVQEGILWFIMVTFKMLV